MTKTLGSVAAVLATASVAWAGGEGNGKGGKPAPKADSPSPLTAPQDPATTIKAASGKGFTISSGDDFSINIANRLQLLWRYTDSDGGQDVNSFRIRRARTAMKGHVFDPRVQYKLQLDWASSTRIKDAWVRYVAWGEEDAGRVGFRLGQQKTRHGKEAEGTSGALDHTTRSLASRTFAGVRATGLWIEGAHADDKLHWEAGVANSDTAGASTAVEGGADGARNRDNELNYFFGISFDPFGDMGGEDLGSKSYKQGDLGHTENALWTFGSSIMVGNHQTAAGAADVETVSWNFNTAVKVAGLHALGEVFLRTDDQTAGPEADATGFAVGASYTMPKPEDYAAQWSFAARYSLVDYDDAPVLLLDPSLGGAAGDVSEINGTVTAYYREHRMKTQIGYTFQTAEPAGGADVDTHQIDVMFQLMF